MNIAPSRVPRLNGLPKPSSSVDLYPLLVSSKDVADPDLADLIEQDGRRCIDLGMPCGMDRYYEAVPDLRAKPISLDAAIDISLRSIAHEDGCDFPEERHTECMLRSYPELSGPIRLAMLLGSDPSRTVGTPGSERRRRIAPPPRSVGATLEDGRQRYELVRALGRGFSGMVCEAIDHGLSDADHSARVAVKLIPITPATVHRQASEATKARRINHPGVVRVLDRGLTDQDEVFLVYELVAGGDLEQWFEARHRTIDAREAVRLVAAVARAVQAAHSAGLVHCDLKPANILITPDGEPRVSDFGVAAIADSAATSAEAENGRLPVGSLAFAAPEQVRHVEAAPSPSVDIYALGGILYHLVTGAMPNGSSPSEISQTHDPIYGRRDPPSLRDVCPDADHRLNRICDRALRRRPDERYQTAAEFATDLQSWLGGNPIPWMRESSAKRAGLWARRSPGTAVLAAACLLAVVAGGFASGYFAHRAQAEKARSAQLNHAIDTSKQGIKQFYERAFKPNADQKPMSNMEILGGIDQLEKNLPAASTSNAPRPTPIAPKPAK